MDWNRALIAATAAVMLAGCNPSTAEAPPSPTDVATTITFEDVAFEEREDVGDPWALRRAADGAMFLVVRVKVANAGETRAPVDALPEITLRDHQGRAYFHDPEATAAFRSEVNSGVAPERSGDLNPGVALTVGLVFELAKDAWSAGGWALHFAGSDETIQLTPRLGSAPPTPSAPAASQEP